jgi:hypothetical protein
LLFYIENCQPVEGSLKPKYVTKNINNKYTKLFCCIDLFLVNYIFTAIQHKQMHELTGMLFHTSVSHSSVDEDSGLLGSYTGSIGE